MLNNKYRVHEVAKDFKKNSKEITDILTKYATAPKNHMQVLEDRELSLIFEYLTQHNQVDNIESIYAEVYREPKTAPAPKGERRYNESLRYYTTSALKEAEELTKAANLQLQQSETGVAEYIQSVTTARDIRRGYIETVYQYNIAALEHELFE